MSVKQNLFGTAASCLWRCCFFFCWCCCVFAIPIFSPHEQNLQLLLPLQIIDNCVIVGALSTVGLSPNKPCRHQLRLRSTPLFLPRRHRKTSFPQWILDAYWHCTWCAYRKKSWAIIFALLRPNSRCVRTFTVQIQLECNAELVLKKSEVVLC